MEKKKSRKYKILFFNFLGIFLFGLIALLVPFNYENYSYSFSTKDVSYLTNYSQNTHTLSFKVTIDDIANQEKFATVSIKFEYIFKDKIKEASVERLIPFSSGKNKISFSYTGEGYGFASNLEIKGIKLKYSDGVITDIYENPLFSTPNLGFMSMAIIGFIVGFIFFILWKTSGKVYIDSKEETFNTSFGNTISQSIKTFEERIKEAFQPVKKESNPKQNQKLTCNYCKCIFDNEKHDKCPHCGAPPERKD